MKTSFDGSAPPNPILSAAQTHPLSGGPSFSLRLRLRRLVWLASWSLLASWTPPQMRGWRRSLLRLFGARIGAGAQVYGSARIWLPENLEMGEGACLGPRARAYAMAKIVIGAGAIVSQDAELCAGSHDISDPQFQLIAKPITIGPRAWVAAGAFVGPGVAIGEGAVLGARAVAFKDIAPWEVHAGNPARFIKRRRMAACHAPQEKAPASPQA